jgi:hypothetical protein
LFLVQDKSAAAGGDIALVIMMSDVGVGYRLLFGSRSDASSKAGQDEEAGWRKSRNILVMSNERTDRFSSRHVPQTKFRIPGGTQGKGTVTRNDDIAHKIIAFVVVIVSTK